MRDAATADAAAAVALLDEALGLGAVRRSPSTPTSRALRPRRAAWRSCGEAPPNLCASALLHAGRVDESVAAAEALATAEPLREGAWTRLIEGLAAQGRTADALRAFQRPAAALAEAGLEPSDTLREIERMVLAGEAAPPVTERVTPAAPRPDPRPPPTPASSFVGRDDECASVVGLLEKTRIVTLVGPGGVGKTRLAIEAARVAANRRSLGARIVELAEIRDAVDVADAVVAALGLTGRAKHRSLYSTGPAPSTSSSCSTTPSTCSTPPWPMSCSCPRRRARVLATSRERLASTASTSGRSLRSRPTNVRQPRRPAAPGAAGRGRRHARRHGRDAARDATRRPAAGDRDGRRPTRHHDRRGTRRRAR